jgi:hypothetical protein
MSPSDPRRREITEILFPTEGYLLMNVGGLKDTENHPFANIMQ